MPKAHKKRGRRAEAQKRKWDDNDDSIESQKRQRTLQVEAGAAPSGEDEQNAYDGHSGDLAGQHGSTQATTFYGLLDQQEQDYFKSAEETLELNQFADKQERSLFLANVYKEAAGKELKMACSQSCSRLLEKLIQLSNLDQLKKLFQVFNSNFLNLTQHRFASHCCEALFIKSAPFATEELVAPVVASEAHASTSASTEEPLVTMENLFLFTINELEGNLGYLMTDRYASHALRVLLMILAGQDLNDSSHKNVLRSKKKEGVDVLQAESPMDMANDKRPIPSSFTTALEKVVQDTLHGLDTNHLRTLAAHESANPVLQILLQCELATFGKQKGNEESSLLKRLLPDDPLVAGTESAAFLSGLLYDPTGSRLYQTIVKYGPGKFFKKIYKEFFKGQTGIIAKQELASYVAAAVLERLGRDDLKTELQTIIPSLPDIVKRNRIHFIRTTIERCVARDVELAPIAEALQQIYSGGDGSLSLHTMLQLPREGFMSAAYPNSKSSTNLEPTSAPRGSLTHPEPIKSTAETIQASLLAQTMLSYPGQLSELLFTALTIVSGPVILQMARTPHLAPVLSTSLTVSHAPVIFRRKLITRLYGHTASLSRDVSGSRVIDAVWKGTMHGLAFARERVAEELAEEESELRANKCGRAVWRNWHMDLYKRQRGEWVRRVREEAGNEGFLSFPDATDSSASPKSIGTLTRSRSGSLRETWHKSPRTGGSGHQRHESGGKTKTKIDLAREKFAASQSAQGRNMA